jgi:hypothetical protein
MPLPEQRAFVLNDLLLRERYCQYSGLLLGGNGYFVIPGGSAGVHNLGLLVEQRRTSDSWVVQHEFVQKHEFTFAFDIVGVQLIGEELELVNKDSGVATGSDEMEGTRIQKGPGDI